MSQSTKEQPPKRVIRRKKKKPLTPKQILVKDSAERRFKIEKLVFVWQEKLFSAAQVSIDTLQQAAAYLQPKTYSEVIEERVVQEWCGYPLCKSPPKRQELQKYRISISQRKVFDQSELANYCSESCYQKSRYYNLQLSDEPVWFRDLSKHRPVHVITAEDDFQIAVQKERNKIQMKKNKEDIKNQYIEHLLSSTPKDKEDVLAIVEKNPEAPVIVNTPESGVYDTLEGYQIEVNRNGNLPTMKLIKNPKKHKEEETETEDITADDPTDPDALFETMMMLKDMHLDQTDSVVAVETPELKKPLAATNAAPKEQIKVQKTQIKSTEETDKDVSVSKIGKEKDKANVINVTTEKPKKSLKKKKGPELSLFGTIWTMLDHMTTKATRIYLSELDKNHVRVDISSLIDRECLNEASQLRGQIFSERILETYSIIRSQLGIHENIEDDIIAVIRTFQFSDASMVALNSIQSYMMTLILFRSLADSLLSDSQWKSKFERCCRSIDQTGDMIDACVRVLKVASV